MNSTTQTRWGGGWPLALVWALGCGWTPGVGAQPSDLVSRVQQYPVLPGQISDAPQHFTNSVRLRIEGTVTLVFAPGAFFLHDESGNIRVQTLGTNRVERGQRVEVTGLPRLVENARWLQYADVRPMGEGRLPAPRVVTATAVQNNLHDAQYVTLTGRVLGAGTYTLRGVTNESLLFDSGGVLGKALFPPGTDAAKLFPPDTVAAFTGICRLGARIEEGRQRYVHILVHDPGEVRVIARPPRWSPVVVGRLVIGFALVAITGLAFILWQRRRMRLLLAAENARRHSEAITQGISTFATSLLEQNTEDDILWDLARNCIAQLGFVDCVVYLLDRERGVLVQKAALGPKCPGGRVILNPITLPLGQGIVGTVAATGHAELIRDTSLDSRYIVDDERRFSELAVPIVADGEVLGVIDSEHPAKNFFTVDNLKMLTAIASLCANKLVRVRAEAKLRQSHQDLERRIAERTAELVAANEQLTREIAERTRAEKVQRALYAISEAIHNVADLPSLYARIHEIIGTLMPAKNFYLALYDAGTDTVSFPYHRDEMDPPPPARKARRGMTEYVLRTGRAALADLEEIARLKAAGEYVQSGAPAKIWLGVPLTASGGRPFGVMAVQDHHNERVYGEEEKQILSFVAGQTALAIERKRAEHDLRVALEAEKELNQLKSSFVSMVSHEFRTPLEVILSSSNILDRYLDRLPPEKRAAQLRAIRKSVHRMNDLIDDVLLLGKFDAGALNCQPAPLDLVAFCRRMTREIESASAREDFIRFTAEDSYADACADEGLLQHILTNVLGNAVKYSPPDRPVEFTLARRGVDAEFIVRDHGCGIPAADQARLFTAFYRGSNVGQKPGSGLGLVIAKRCVDLHGGEIRCRSVEGAGTTFCVTLPLFDGTRVFRRRFNGGDQPSPAFPS